MSLDLAPESARLAELAAYRILDSGPEASFDALAQAAALVALTPTAAIGLVDDSREWFKASVGLDLLELPRQDAFCDHVVRERRPILVEDATADPRFAGNPLVTAEGGIRFYAGFPLTASSGAVIGSLSVTDSQPRTLDPTAVRILWTLADQAMAQIELRRQTAEACAARDDAQRREILLHAVLDSVDVGILVCDEAGSPIADNASNREMFGWAVGDDVDVRHRVATPLAMTDRSGRPLADDERPLARTLREGRVDGMQILVHPPFGAARALRVTSGLLTTTDGTPLGAILATHDETAVLGRELALSQQVQDVERLAEASRLILADEDPAGVACVNLLELVGARQVSVLRPDELGRLRVTATTQQQLAGLVVPTDVASLANDVFRSQVPIVVDLVDGIAQPYGASTRLIREAHGTARTAMYRPLLHDGDCSGVLVISLEDKRSDVAARTELLLGIVVDRLSLSLSRDRLRRELAVQATTDALTGLANRRVWDERLDGRLADTEPACLAILDLDHFKAYNDEHGHSAGDDLLRMASAAWSGALRADDLLARIGGEEFGLLLRGCTARDAVSVLDKLRARVPYGQTASIGVAQRRQDEAPQDWSARADRALYRAKAAGRDRVVVDDSAFVERRLGRAVAPARELRA